MNHHGVNEETSAFLENVLTYFANQPSSNYPLILVIEKIWLIYFIEITATLPRGKSIQKRILDLLKTANDKNVEVWLLFGGLDLYHALDSNEATLSELTHLFSGLHQFFFLPGYSFPMRNYSHWVKPLFQFSELELELFDSVKRRQIHQSPHGYEHEVFIKNTSLSRVFAIVALPDEIGYYKGQLA